MKKVRLLLLGTGGMAGSHANAYKLDPRVEITACSDIDATRAATFAASHGIAQSFDSLDKALAWGGFDAASNVTPDAIHFPTTMRLLDARKHVLCEKPLAESFELADKMASAADAAGLVNMVNLSYRNVPALEQARKMIEAGDIGTIRHLEASYRQSWLVGTHWGNWRTDPKWLWRLSERHGSKGVLGDVGIHILDFATYAIGMMPVSLQARLKTFHKAPGDAIGEYPLDANDSATMSVEFENGALGVIHTSRFMTGYGNVLKLDVFGDRGAIRIEHGLDWTEMFACTGEDVHTQAWRRVISEPVDTIYKRFIDAVLAGTNGVPDFRRAADLQKILDACYSADAAAGASLV